MTKMILPMGTKKPHPLEAQAKREAEEYKAQKKARLEAQAKRFRAEQSKKDLVEALKNNRKAFVVGSDGERVFLNYFDDKTGQMITAGVFLDAFDYIVSMKD